MVAKIAVLVLRTVPVIAVVRLSPLLLGTPQQLHDESPDILGPSALFTLLASFAVTPLATVTGWRWHIILRRDFALWAAGFAFTDLLISATTSPHGPLFGLGGAAGITTGVLAALLLIPLVLTSNRWSMRLLGRDWKRLHLLVYPVLGLVAAHLYFIGDSRSLTLWGAVVVPLIVLRLPPVRRRIVRARKRRRAAKSTKEAVS